MKKDFILDEIESTFSGLKKIAEDISSDQFNKIHYEGSWSAGQIIFHVIKSVSGFIMLMNGPVIDTNRIPGKMITRIEEDFSNYNIKMESPEFVIPENKIYKKEELLNSLLKYKIKLSDAVMQLDLTKTCIFFELPVYGSLTRLEAVHFVINHTKRHTHQLKNLLKKISETDKA